MITIVTAYTPGTIYQEIAEENRKRCEAFSYRFIAHELEDSQDLHGSPPKATFKPRLLFDETIASANTDDGQVVWVDADVVLIRPIDDAMGEADGFVTLRDAAEIGQYTAATSYLNSGVVGARTTLSGVKFLATWLKECAMVGEDQRALNRVFYPWDYDLHRATKFWKGVANPFGEYDGVRILPCAIYNHLHPGVPSPGCKVLHFRHGILAGKPKDWWREKIAEALT